MRHLFVLSILIAFGSLWLPGQRAAAQTEPPPVIDLVGTWVSAYHENGRWDGTSWGIGRVTHEMIITEQRGMMVRGSWRLHVTQLDGQGRDASVQERDVQLIGAISWSGDQITLVNHSEKNAIVFQGRILNPITIELIAYEAGERGWIEQFLLVRR